MIFIWILFDISWFTRQLKFGTEKYHTYLFLKWLVLKILLFLEKINLSFLAWYLFEFWLIFRDLHKSKQPRHRKISYKFVSKMLLLKNLLFLEKNWSIRAFGMIFIWIFLIFRDLHVNKTSELKTELIFSNSWPAKFLNKIISKRYIFNYHFVQCCSQFAHRTENLSKKVWKFFWFRFSYFFFVYFINVLCTEKKLENTTTGVLPLGNKLRQNWLSKNNNFINSS
jgi:hypothetical protein